ncbi:MAG: hypothetical protein GX663_02835 [Clostridiales bacterium]|nr:hypothetical protein [Clostridiales bacterium]
MKGKNLFDAAQYYSENRRKKFEKALKKSTQAEILEFVLNRAFPSDPVFIALEYLTDEGMLFQVASTQQIKSIAGKTPVIQVGITERAGVDICVQAIMQMKEQTTLIKLFENYANNSPLYGIYNAGSTYNGGYEKIDALVKKLSEETRRDIIENHQEWNKGSMECAFKGGEFSVSNGTSLRTVIVSKL